MAQHRSMIDQLTVRSDYDYIVYGSVRGLVSEHRSVQAARASADNDRRDCGRLGGGAYSDVNVYCWDDEDGWVCDYTDE